MRLAAARGGSSRQSWRERGMRGRPGPGNPPTKTHYYFVSLEGGDKSVLKLRLRNLSWHWLANGWLVFTGSDTCDKEQAGGSRRGGRTEQDIVATQLILSCRPPSSMLLPQSRAGCCSEFSRQTLEHLAKLRNQLSFLDVGWGADRWVVHAD